MRHLIFLFVDHFEPRTIEDVKHWSREYPRAVDAFGDSGGNNPKHSWFYDGDDPAVLDELGGLCRKGYGEIELHLHHGNDTAEGLRAKIFSRLARYSKHGASVTTEKKQRLVYGFIHGKWSLDNSRGDEHCGVNNELIVLRETGCFADFTFPAWGRMQPSKSKSIYYATDDPIRPKSYDTGVDVEVGKPPSGDLMIFQGPTRLSGIPRKFARLPGLVKMADRFIGTCAVDEFLPPWPARIDRWVRAGVHVKGRADWVFVKVHTHGARSDNAAAYLAEWAAKLHAHLALRYNDGANWRLHYVTAREAYNIAKAAEAGMTGDPEAHRNFAIGPYQNTR